MAITCPRCKAEFDHTLFEFDRRIECDCGEKIAYPGTRQYEGHVLVQHDNDKLGEEIQEAKPC